MRYTDRRPLAAFDSGEYFLLKTAKKRFFGRFLSLRL
jgi:hypothetical protein